MTSPKPAAVALPVRDTETARLALRLLAQLGDAEVYAISRRPEAPNEIVLYVKGAR